MGDQWSVQRDFDVNRAIAAYFEAEPQLGGRWYVLADNVVVGTPRRRVPAVDPDYRRPCRRRTASLLIFHRHEPYQPA